MDGDGPVPALPPDLVPGVLALVCPLAARARLRGVCRAWLAVLERPGAWGDATGPDRTAVCCAAAGRGSVPALDWAERSLRLAVGDMLCIGSAANQPGVPAFRAGVPALELACGGGHLAAAQWIYTRFGDQPVDGRGNFIVIQAWMRRSEPIGRAALLAALRGGHLGGAAWAVGAFELVLGHGNIADCVAAACRGGHPAAAQWVADAAPAEFAALGVWKNAFEFIEGLLTDACGRGDLPVAVARGRVRGPRRGGRPVRRPAARGGARRGA